MRFSIYLLLSVFWGCSQKKPEYSYIKIFKTATTDSVNGYNKGMGVSSFVFYSPKNDSLFYSILSGENTKKFKIYTSQIKSTNYYAIFDSIIYSFKTKTNGIIPDRIPGGSAYCGPEYYLEFVYNSKKHYYLFILDGDPTFELVDSLFNQLYNWSKDKKIANITYFNPDKEVVNAAQKLGVYNKMEVPYIPLKCNKEINYSKLIGDWRIISEYQRSRNNYRKISITSNGEYIIEKIDNNKNERKAAYRYNLNKQKNELRVLQEKNTTEKYKIEIVSDSCLQLFHLKYNTSIRFNRL